MSRVFIDTAVFARLADDRRPRERDAAARLLSAPQWTPVTNALVLGQLYSALVPRDARGARGRALAEAGQMAVERVRPLATLDLTAAHVALALDLVRERQMQLWDAVNWASAIAGACTEYASFDAPGQPHVVRGVRFIDPLGL
jgi:predicted nucleic acid-binding protein